VAKPKPKAKSPVRPKTKAKAKTRPKAAPLPDVPPHAVLGLRTVIYKVADVARAKTFYAALLGRAPYFDQPYYVGFDVGGYELGLDPDVSHAKPGAGGTHAYWRVGDISAAWVHALSSGAEPIEPPHSVGIGVDVALVTDPFGNFIGLIQTAAK
jgi:predicted enzyme related to lactoylglutathione lyase